MRALLGDEHTVRVVGSVDQLDGYRPDVSLLAIKPQQLGELAKAPGLAAVLGAGVVVSILAGMPLQAVSKALQC